MSLCFCELHTVGLNFRCTALAEDHQNSSGLSSHLVLSAVDFEIFHMGPNDSIKHRLDERFKILTENTILYNVC